MEVVEYRDMVVVVRDVVADLMKQGKTLDADQGRAPGAALRNAIRLETTDHERVRRAVYKSLAAKKK